MARSSGSGKKERNFPAKRASYKAEKTSTKISQQEDTYGYRSNYTFKEVEPLNFIQGEYLEAIRHNDIIFGIGSAGTGKTYIAASYAASELFQRKVSKIILT